METVTQSFMLWNWAVWGSEKNNSHNGKKKKKTRLKNIDFLFQSCAKEDCMNGYDGLIKEEEIHSLILIETPESSNSEKEHR